MDLSQLIYSCNPAEIFSFREEGILLVFKTVYWTFMKLTSCLTWIKKLKYSEQNDTLKGFSNYFHKIRATILACEFSQRCSVTGSKYKYGTTWSGFSCPVLSVFPLDWGGSAWNVFISSKDKCFCQSFLLPCSSKNNLVSLVFSGRNLSSHVESY